MRMIADNRLSNIELLRSVACFGIVWFHAQAPYREVGYGGLIVFVVIYVFFLIKQRTNRSLFVKAKRLLIPWVFWSFIYGILKIADAWLSKEPLAETFDVSTIFIGTSLHLWYLPFSFLVAVILPCQIWNKSKLIQYSFIFAFAIIVSAILMNVEWLQKTVPLPQYIFSVPALAMGFSLACIEMHEFSSLRKFAILFLFVTVGSVGAILFDNIPYAMLYLGASIACMLAWLIDINNFNIKKLIVILGGLSYGIYLIHPLTISLIIRIGPNQNKSLVAIVAFVMAGCLTFFMQQTKLKIVV